MKNQLLYRPCVAILIKNADDLYFAGERIDTPGAWQIPQGGVDKGEDIIDAAFREAEEEIGVKRQMLNFQSISNDWVQYDLPPAIQRKAWKGQYAGQQQKWVLLAFDGSDCDINIATKHPEFQRWQWMNKDDLLNAIVDFKKEVYEQGFKALGQ